MKKLFCKHEYTQEFMGNKMRDRGRCHMLSGIYKETCTKCGKTREIYGKYILGEKPPLQFHSSQRKGE